jgi:hypothetical protein
MSHEDAMSVLLLDYKFFKSKEFSFPPGTGRKGSKRGLIEPIRGNGVPALSFLRVKNEL